MFKDMRKNKIKKIDFKQSQRPRGSVERSFCFNSGSEKFFEKSQVT